MNAFDFRGNQPTHSTSPAPPEDRPVSCPTCHSSAIVTKAKHPDSSSYWRCEACGEMWNVARSQVARRSGTWR